MPNSQWDMYGRGNILAFGLCDAWRVPVHVIPAAPVPRHTIPCGLLRASRLFIRGDLRWREHSVVVHGLFLARSVPRAHAVAAGVVRDAQTEHTGWYRHAWRIGALKTPRPARRNAARCLVCCPGCCLVTRSPPTSTRRPARLPMRRNCWRASSSLASTGICFSPRSPARASGWRGSSHIRRRRYLWRLADSCWRFWRT
jgi:hypothetical protein